MSEVNEAKALRDAVRAVPWEGLAHHQAFLNRLHSLLENRFRGRERRDVRESLSHAFRSTPSPFLGQVVPSGSRSFLTGEYFEILPPIQAREIEHRCFAILSASERQDLDPLTSPLFDDIFEMNAEELARLETRLDEDRAAHELNPEVMDIGIMLFARFAGDTEHFLRAYPADTMAGAVWQAPELEHARDIFQFVEALAAIYRLREDQGPEHPPAYVFEALLDLRAAPADLSSGMVFIAGGESTLPDYSEFTTW